MPASDLLEEDVDEEEGVDVEAPRGAPFLSREGHVANPKEKQRQTLKIEMLE